MTGMMGLSWGPVHRSINPHVICCFEACIMTVMFVLVTLKSLLRLHAHLVGAVTKLCPHRNITQ